MVPNAAKLGTSWLGMTVLRGFRGPKQALGPSQGVQGGTKEAPGRHRGGTREAPRRNLHINMGPRAAPIKTAKSYNTIMVNDSGHKTLTQ